MRWADGRLLVLATGGGSSWPSGGSSNTVHVLTYSPSGDLVSQDTFVLGVGWSASAPLLVRGDQWIALVDTRISTNVGSALYVGTVGEVGASLLRSYAEEYQHVMPVPGDPSRLIVARPARDFGAVPDQYPAELTLVETATGDPVSEGAFPIETDGFWQEHERSETLFGGTSTLSVGDGVTSGGWSTLGAGGFNRSQTRFYGRVSDSVRAFDAESRETLWTSSAFMASGSGWPSAGAVSL
jgi:hypothetical protein